jgi:lipoate-protein ligase A
LLFDFDFEAVSSVWSAPCPALRIMAEEALHTQVVTLGQLSVPGSPKQLTDLLIKSFAESFGRPLQVDTLTLDEICAVEEEARQLASPDFLELHQTCPTPKPTRTLKISARALIRADEVDENGCHV